MVAAADRLIANTAEEARQLTELYGADPAKVQTVNPGADLSVFRPGAARDGRAAARRRLGVAPDAVVLFRRAGAAAQGAGRRAQGRGRLLEADPGAARKPPGGPRRRPERATGAAPTRTGCGSSPRTSASPTCAVRAPVSAGRARPVVPGGDAGAHPVAFGVVRACRA